MTTAGLGDHRMTGPLPNGIDGHRSAKRRRWWIAGLLSFVGANAVFAGYGFIAKPDGSAIGIPHEWLEGTPFPDYQVPGVILLALGIGSLVAALAQARRFALAWALSGTLGIGYVVWIVVQSAMMGSFRHPMQTALQALVLSIGIAVSVLSCRQYGDWRRAG